VAPNTRLMKSGFIVAVEWGFAVKGKLGKFGSVFKLGSDQGKTPSVMA